MFDEHQKSPKATGTLSSHDGGGGHGVAASHAFLHFFFCFLHTFFPDPPFVQSSKASLQSSLQSSEFWHSGEGDGGGGDGDGGGEGDGDGGEGEDDGGGGEGDGGGLGEGGGGLGEGSGDEGGSDVTAIEGGGDVTPGCGEG